MKKVAAAITGALLLWTTGIGFGATMDQVVLSSKKIDLAPGNQTFSVEVSVDASTAYSAAEFGVKLTGDLRFAPSKSFEFDKRIKSNKISREYEGVYYFGFFGDKNQHEGNLKIGTMHFETFGSGNGTIELTMAQVVRIIDSKTVVKSALKLPATVVVTKRATGYGNDGNNSGTPQNPTPPAPGNNGENNGKATGKTTQVVVVADNAKTISVDLNRLKAPVKETHVAKEEIKTIEKGASIVFEGLGAYLKLGNTNKSNSFDVVLRTLKNEALEELAPIKVPNVTLKQTSELFAFNSGSDIEKQAFRLSLPYNAESVKSTEKLSVYGFNEKTGKWEPMGGMVDPVNHMVTFTTYGTGQYAIFEGSRTFKDLSKVPDAKLAIEVLASKGIVNGLNDNEFKPNNKVTRAELATILVKAFDLQADRPVAFKDLNTQWHAEALNIAGGSGIISGSNGNANPDGVVTREQLAVIITKAYEYQQKKPLTVQGTLTYKDVAQISPWAKSAVIAMSKADLMSGKTTSTFDPKAKITRAEAAEIIYNTLKLLMKEAK